MTADPRAPAGSGSLTSFILASASPRRQSLLRDAGFKFVVHPADIDEESFGAGLLPADLAHQLALAKAEKIAGQFPDTVVLAADTVVAFGDQALGKPGSAEDAQRMLTLLEGTTHVVITGVAVMRKNDGRLKSARVLSAVQMKPLSAGEIETYVATNAWRGKAGGYGIQDPDPFVVRLSGCPTNIVGLPMTATPKLLDYFQIYPKPVPG